MPEPNRWYVSYTVQSDHGPRRKARVTKRSILKDTRSLFAREIAVHSLRLTAGTINPHSPKGIVSATEIAAWLEEADQLGSCDAAGQTGSEKRSS